MKTLGNALRDRGWTCREFPQQTRVDGAELRERLIAARVLVPRDLVGLRTPAWLASSPYLELDARGRAVGEARARKAIETGAWDEEVNAR